MKKVNKVRSYQSFVGRVQYTVHDTDRCDYITYTVHVDYYRMTLHSGNPFHFAPHSPFYTGSREKCNFLLLQEILLNVVNKIQ